MGLVMPMSYYVVGYTAKLVYAIIVWYMLDQQGRKAPVQSNQNVCVAYMHVRQCVCYKYACKALYGSAGIEGESALERRGG